MARAPRLNIDPTRRILIALAISVLVHIATVWKLPPVDLDLSLSPEIDKSGGPLIVQLMPPETPPPRPRPSAPATPPRAQALAPAPSQPPRKRAERPATPPPVIARKEGAAALPPSEPRTPVPPASASPAPSPAGDLAAYVEARRHARGETSAPAPANEAPPAPRAEDENARANRLAALNLGLDRKPTFGSDTRRGGGVFQITRMSYDYAEFMFFGWNKDIRRDTRQTIDVRKGSESDIRVAVIRRMIAIIREHEEGDFVWESHRLNRHVTLSARPRDSSGLEEFLWREFFEDSRRPAQRP